MNLIWQQVFEIRSFDVGPGGQIRVDALMGLLQETANAQSSSWKIGVADLMTQAKTWVLSRYRLQLERLPLMGETIQVRSWASGAKAQFTQRDFEVLDAQDKPIARASTSWVVLDLKTHAPLDLEGIVRQEFILDRHAIDAPFQKMCPFEQASQEIELAVQERDLDLNRHVNHAVYPSWAFEVIAPEIRRGFGLRDLEVSYRAEAFYGDVIRSRLMALDTSEDTLVFQHQILNKASGNELTRLVSHWRTRKSA